MKCLTDFKREYDFGGTGGGRLRKPCRECRHFKRGGCRHPDALDSPVCKETALYKGCRKGWEAKR